MSRGTPSARAEALRARLDGPVWEVAPRLLGLVLTHGPTAGLIVEVEAYRGRGDPASHAASGRTARNASMFGPPGTAYVYFTYGRHWCVNVVAEPAGEPAAVLVRALSPLRGRALMGERRARPREREWCSGPARLCQALAITGTCDGLDLLDPDSPLRLIDDGEPPPPTLTGPRVGIRRAARRRWRWGVEGDPNLSRPLPRPG